MSRAKPPKLVLAALYGIYFLDLAGLVIVYVLFAPLLLEQGALLPGEFSQGQRNVILGLLFAAYPLTQFFGAPILGELSDRFGRRKPLYLSALFTGLAFFLSSLALSISSLSLLFISRFFAGLTAGNMTIAQAATGDLIEQTKRPRYMAAFNIVGGVSWSIAPFMGSILANPLHVSWFSSATPFWMLGALFLIFAWIVKSQFKESGVIKEASHLHIGKVFKDLLKTLEVPTISPLLLISILAIFGWMMYQGFMSPYLHQRYGFSEQEIGLSFSYFSLWWFVSGVLANQWLLKKYHSGRVNAIPMAIAALSIFSFLFFAHPTGMWYASAVANVAQSLSLSCFFALFSVIAPPNIQGKVFGFWNAGFALASTIAPILAGALAAYDINLPFFVSFLLLAASFLFFARWHARHKHESREI